MKITNSIAAAFCAFATAGLFYPILAHRFVNLEDYWLIADNPHLRRLSWPEIKWMFTSLEYGTYQPLGWLTYAVIYAWRGLDPAAYHFASWLAHAACTAMLFFTAVRITRAGQPRRRGAVELGCAAAALAWAVHPMRVEPVAWATGLPDLLASLFFLAAVRIYLRPGGVGLCLILYVVSSLFRWKGVSLPAVLILLDVFVLRLKLDRRTWREKLPFVFVAAAFSAANAWSKLLLAPGHAFDAGLHTLAGPVFYLGKLLAPLHLTVDYWVARSPLLAGAFTLLTGALLWSRRARPAAAAWGCFVFALLPSLVMSFRGGVAAHDRSTYLPSMSLHVLLAAGMTVVLSEGRRRRVAALAASVGVLAGLGLLTRAQLPVWRDSESLWRHVLSEAAPPDYAHLSLAHALREQGRRDEAAAELREQLRLFPGDRRVETLARELGLRLSIDRVGPLPYNPRTR